jgi:putative NADH-flavin reductase
MRVAIFGATGGLGRLLTAGALAGGHAVTVLARTPATLGDLAPRLAVVRGAVGDLAAVEAVVGGQDAVIVALGVKPTEHAGTFYSDSTATIVRAMRERGARRLICVSSWVVRDSLRHADPLSRVIGPLLLRGLYVDRERQEAAVRASGLEWVLVRPARLTDGARTGAARGAPDLAIGLTARVTRADAADFVLSHLTDDTYLRQAVGIRG